jgi:hypothetical protein
MNASNFPLLSIVPKNLKHVRSCFFGFLKSLLCYFIFNKYNFFLTNDIIEECYCQTNKIDYKHQNDEDSQFSISFSSLADILQASSASLLTVQIVAEGAITVATIGSNSYQPKAKY